MTVVYGQDFFFKKRSCEIKAIRAVQASKSRSNELISSLLPLSRVLTCRLTHIKLDSADPRCSRIANYSEASKEQWCSSVYTEPQQASVRDTETWDADAWSLITGGCIASLVCSDASLRCVCSGCTNRATHLPRCMKKLQDVRFKVAERLREPRTVVAPDGWGNCTWKISQPWKPVRLRERRKLLWFNNDPLEAVWRR